MLQRLTIRDFVIVDRLDLAFQPGFTVLTGETGAGKSLLIDALGLLLGGRFESGMVRAGQDKADLTAEFDLSALPEARAWLAEQELAGDEPDQLLLRRVLDAQGKSRAFINGTAATVQQLREIGEQLVDIHGQHAHQSLMRGDAQRALLDDYAGAAELARQVSAAHQQWRALERAQREAEAQQAERTRELEQLDWQIRELEPITLPPDAYQQLLQDHSRLTHAATLLDGAASGVDALLEGDQALLPPLTQLAQRLRELTGIDATLGEPCDLIDNAVIQLQEAAYSLRHYANRRDLDPAELTRLDNQLGELHMMARKHRVQPEQLHDTLQAARARRDALAAQQDPAAQAAALAAARTAYQQAAEKLSKLRQKAADKLAESVNKTLALLAMAGSRFSVALLPLAEPSGGGLETVEYRIGHHGATAQSLAKIASGGELSRVSLAIQVAMTTVAKVPTLIFDEVDVGIGGRVADIVGRLLRELGDRHQVMSITHLPQVAARGHQHWQVSKSVEQQGVTSRIRELDHGDRTEEIARMLGGATITDTTRDHARELLAG